MLKSLRKYLEVILGMMLVAISFDLFISPLKIVIGGTNGIAVIINQIFKIDTSLFIAIFYAFSLILNIIFFGLKGTKNLILGSIFYPILVSLFETLPNYVVLDYNNKLLLYLVASVLMGIGNGLIYKNNYIAGGVDVIKKVINERFKVSMGVCAFIIDTIIVLSGGFIFGIKSILYAIIILYISSKITDKIILGISTKKMFYIMTIKPDEVRNAIVKELKCGITELDAVGGYTENKNHILMCVIPTRDYIKLKAKVNSIDEKAFFLITDSYHMYHKEV